MSLKSFLEMEEVNEKFKCEFKEPDFDLDCNLLVSSTSKNPELIDNAFKYLISFELEKENQNFSKSTMTAQYACDLAKIMASDEFYKKSCEILEKFQQNFKVYKNMEKKSSYKPLIQSAFYLAQLDNYFKNQSQKIKRAHPGSLKELENLMGLFDTSLFNSKEVCLWNPSFEAARLVGGAQIDLIVDDMLIIINNSENLNSGFDDFNQLMGQYILMQIGNIKEMGNEHKIRKIAIYFSRFAFLHTMDIDSIINKQLFLHWWIGLRRELLIPFIKNIFKNSFLVIK